jgi:DNA-binding GntR family transcriptional regulator
LNNATDNKDVAIRVDLRRIVLERIVSGALAPNIRVKEAHLARELGVSRTPLREALIGLEQEGFVRSELAHGFTVEPLSGREVREIYPILWTLETLALRASGGAVYALAEKLLEINARLARSADSEERLQLDTEWHDTLLSKCPNRRLKNLLSGLKTAAARYENLFMADAALVIESVRQHQQITVALQAGDVDLAECVLIENWRVSMELLLVRLGEP